jgi:hypothetical protein
MKGAGDVTPHEPQQQDGDDCARDEAECPVHRWPPPDGARPRLARRSSAAMPLAETSEKAR